MPVKQPMESRPCTTIHLTRLVQNVEEVRFAAQYYGALASGISDFLFVDRIEASSHNPRKIQGYVIKLSVKYPTLCYG